MARTVALVAGLQRAGFVFTTPHQLGPGDNRAVVALDRTAWPDTGKEVVRGTGQVSYDNGLTWEDLFAFGARGGVQRKGGVEVPASWASRRVGPERGTPRLVRARLEFIEDLNTACALEADDKAPRQGFVVHNSVAYDNSDIVSGNASSLTISNFVVANNSDRLLLMLSGLGAAGGSTASGWAWGADGATEIYDAIAQGDYHVGAARLIAPAAATRDVTVTFANTSDCALAALSLYNVDQTTPVGAVRTTNAASGTVWVGTAGVADGMAVGWWYGSAMTSTPVDGLAEYISVGTATSSSGATSLTPSAAPAGRIYGDLEFASIATENNDTIGVSGAGWAQVGTTVTQGTTWQEALFCRVYDGSNVDPAFSWSGSVGCSARRWIIRDGLTAGTFGSHTNNNGSASTHTITGVNASANNAVFMYVDHAEANTALGADAGYVEKFDAGSATGPYRLTAGTRDEATSGAGADNFSATGAGASWVMRLLEIPCHASGPQTHREEAENLGGDSCGLATETGAEYNQFGWTGGSLLASHAIAFIVNPAAAGDITGTAGVTEAPDTASASGTLTVTGSAAPAEALDASAASGLVIVAGSATPAEADDTPAASGLVSVVGNAAPVEAVDTAAGSGALAVIGSASPAEANDTADGTGNVPIDITGSAAPVEADDSASATGLVLQNVTGAGAPGEANDAAAAAALVQVIGTSDAVEDADTATASGLINVTGSAAPAEADDIASGAGTVSENVTGNAAAIEENDAAAASGTLIVTGAASASEAADEGTAAGLVIVAGSAAPVEDDDTAVANGEVSEQQPLVEDLNYIVTAAARDFTARATRRQFTVIAGGRSFAIAARGRDYTVAANGRTWEVAA